MRTTVRTVLLSSAAILLLVTAALAQSPQGGPPPDIPQDWWASVRENIAASEYHVTWQDSTQLEGVEAAWQAPNRAQGFRAYFTGNGIRVIPRTEAESSWEWGLALVGYGRGASMWPVGSATLAPQDNRIDYRRGDVTEWYVNSPDGIEQGFTLHRPPREAGVRLGAEARPVKPPTGIPGTTTDDGDEPVHLLLSLGGSLKPTISADGLAIDFAAPEGANVVHYAHLRVTDARGTELPAWMEGIAQGGISGIRLVIDDNGAVYPLTVDPLATAAAWWAESNQVSATMGYAVGAAGDVDGDGYGDVIVGAYNYDNGQSQEGRASVFHGTAHGLRSYADWTAESDQEGGRFGIGVGTAGDVNGDGYSDVIVGADFAGQTEGGRAYVYHGSAEGLSTSADWTVACNQTGAEYGRSVATAGDVNSDGFSDVIVGARHYENDFNDEGGAFVYYGSASGLDHDPGTSGCDFDADWCADSDLVSTNFGVSVGTAGDVNGDGYADVIIGASGYGSYEVGKAYVFHGSSGGLSAVADWETQCSEAWCYYGTWVGTAGDVNGDGYSDVIVGAWAFGMGYPNEPDEGKAYVYHGSPSGLSGTADWTVESDQDYARLGSVVGTAGDVNGDGYADVIVGARSYDNPEYDEGRAFVFLGSSSGLSGGPAAHPADADWTAEGNQESANFGSVATAGDVNGDGYSDVIIGAYSYDNGQIDEGRAFVFHGSASGLVSSSAWSAQSNQASATFGRSVATAGDVNGDGFSDVIVGADKYDHGQTDEGMAFVYYGTSAGLDNDPGTSGCPVGADWCAESDQANAYFGDAVSTAGDVDGDGYDDIIIGAHYWDEINSNVGKVFAWYGSPTGLGPNGTPSNADWSRAQLSHQTVAPRFGDSVAAAGDVNGDGYADVVIGAWYAHILQSDDGAAFVYHGSASGLGASYAWTEHGGATCEGCKFGSSVSTAGDVNGDGYSDVIISAVDWNWPDEHGAAFVFYGTPTGLDHDDGGSGCLANADWCAEGTQTDEFFGESVSTAGDVNGDGYSDVIVGAMWYTNNSPDDDYHEGAAFVYLGSVDGLDHDQELSGCFHDADWCAEGERRGGALGNSVGTAGDVNGDGYSDVIIGAHQWPYASASQEYGRAYVFLGSAMGLGDIGTPDNADWTGTPPVDVDNTEYGKSVGTAGDVNGDGYSDVIVGAHAYESGQTDEGGAWVYYGNGSAGLSLAPQQRKSDDSAPISHLGITDPPSNSSFRIALLGRTPFGRGKVKMQWEVEELGRPFDGLGTGTSTTWEDAGPAGYSLNEAVTGLDSAVYHWRARLLYDPVTTPFQRTGRWVTLPWSGLQEADLRTAAPPTAWCIDEDGDGWGTFGDCTAGLGDCDDFDDQKFPTNVEVCDGKDNDCDGSIDEDGVCVLGSSTLTFGDTADPTRDVAWGDYDGDGDLDLAVANGSIDQDPPVVNRVYRNNNGSLELAWSSVEAEPTQAVAWGDWDGDLDLDLAVANQGGYPVRIYRNTGDGFEVGWTATLFDYSNDVAWGDWDNDGDLDLAVAKHGPSCVYENVGGGMVLAWTVPSGATTRSVAWGDWDNDGDLDLAMGNDGQANRVYENDGGTLKYEEGEFGWQSTETDYTYSVSWGDRESGGGDGDLDLAVGNKGQANRVYRNDGGSLALDWSTTQIDNTYSVAWGDWNNDGDLDLAVGNDGQANRVYRTSTDFWSSSGDSGDQTRSIAWADWDNDGDLDLVAGNSEGQNRLYENNETSFRLEIVADADSDQFHDIVAWGDWDGDGDLDLASASPYYASQITVFQNEVEAGGRTLSLTDEAFGPVGLVRSLAWGDRDGDGDLDLAAGYEDAGEGVTIFTNTGGWLASTQSRSFPYPVSAVAWGDCDRDGDLDLALGMDGGPDQVWTNDGSGGLFSGAEAWTSARADSTESLVWGDWDGDGDLDLAAGIGGQPDLVYENVGGCRFFVAWESEGPADTRSVAWGDWDGDGDLDLAAGVYGGSNLVYENTGGALRTAWRSTEVEDTSSVAWGDLEGDGDLDLLVSNDQPRNARVYVNHGKRGLSLVSTNTVGYRAEAAWGDWDNDGDLDFARGNYTTICVFNGWSMGSPLAFPETPVQVSASRPGITDDAFFFSSPEILGWNGGNPVPVQIPYTLYDGQGDRAPGILHEYSTDGGGTWTDASPGSGGDPESNLAASPTGTGHTFSWDAEEDDVCSDHVVFRIGVKWQAPHHAGAPIQRGEVCATTPAFRVGGTRVDWWRDIDGDGFGDPAQQIDPTCWPQQGYVTNDDDCDDDSITGGAIFPGAPQLCGDLTNNDCEHANWPDLVNTNEFDDDTDGYTECEGDCNDADVLVYPLAQDHCDAPGEDENCDGLVDGGDANGNGDGDACDLSADGLFAEADVATSAAWGDWDDDGDLDLAVGTLSGSPVRLYENDGTGALALAWSSTETEDTYGVAWGDWDDDGDLDLAVGNYGQENRVYENDGGTLTVAWSSTAQTDGTRSVAWGDWDDDGDLDLAVGNDGQANRVFENDGLGSPASLVEAWTSFESDPTHAVAWGDWDGDGDLDLAVGNGLDTTPLPVVNRVYTNDGLGESGSLALDWSSAEADPTHAVAWGDWDGDGDLDLAVGNGLDELADAVVDRVYVNDGLGGLAAGWSSLYALDTRGVAWGDRDGDGDLDLAVAAYGARDRVYENGGSGLATTASWFAGVAYATDFSRSVAWGDRDGDGDLDLAFAVEDAAVAVRVHHSKGSPLGTGAAPWASPGFDSTSAVAWGDWDNDGDLDLAVANYGQPCRVYDNDAGAFTLAWSSPYTDWSYDLAWGDWDGDFDLDLAVGNYGEPNRIYENTGGILTPAWNSAETDWTVALAWGDRDGDGDLDLAVANDGQANRVYDNDGLGNSSSLTLAWSSIETDASFDVAWGNWDQDLPEPDLDLAFANWNQPNRVYANDGSGDMTLVWSSDESNYSYAVAWGDWDGDGDLDLAVANDGEPNLVYNNDGLGNPDSLDAVGWSSAETDDSYGIAWGDWDNDGDLDLATGNWSQPNRVYRNDGGSLSLAWSSAESDATVGIAWGDPDNDGDLDLAVAGWNGPNRVYANGWADGAATLPETPVRAVASRPGNTAGAYFLSSAEKLDDPVQIPYTLYDAQSDRAREIVAEYSVNGGGAWLPATEGAGGDGTTDLAASPDGVAHTFAWNVTTDGVKNEDHVVFRIRVPWQAPDHAGGPIQRAELSAATPPFRVGDPVWYEDADSDGYGNPGVTLTQWEQPPGYVARNGDCDDTAAEIHPGAAQVCDGLNNDCDHPAWPALTGTNEYDDDGDTFTECALDCDDANPATYAGAPEINDGLDNQCSEDDPGYGLVDEITGLLEFQDKTTLTWPAQGGATQYEVLRSGRADFSTDCWTRNERPSDNFSTDTEEPVSGAVFHYLVRAFAPNPGSWGQESAGAERDPACD